MLTPPPGSDKIRTLRNHIMTTGSEIRTYLICAARPDSHDGGLLPSNVIWIEFLGILLSKLFQGFMRKINRRVRGGLHCPRRLRMDK
jgi:hypothetical protein